MLAEDRIDEVVLHINNDEACLLWVNLEAPIVCGLVAPGQGQRRLASLGKVELPVARVVEPLPVAIKGNGVGHLQSIILDVGFVTWLWQELRTRACHRST